MPHTIEVAKTGRAKCRGCKQAIAKDELRFGEEVLNTFGGGGEMSYQWYHLACGAKTRPVELEAALAGWAGDVPDRPGLEALIADSKKKVKPSTFPYAERSPSGRSKCLACEELIEKGTLRIAIEREVDTGSFVSRSAGYLHPACAPAYVAQSGADGGGPAKLLEEVRAHSTQLEEPDLDELAETLATAAQTGA
jgi:hypothetical protein